MMLTYIPYPSWITPEIIPGLPIRWYGLMYILAFGVTYLLIITQVRQKKLSMTSDDITSLMLWCIVGLLIGARIAATTIYDPSGYYLRNPWLIFWPFQGGRFTGLQGMSYHGGVVGAVLGGYAYSRKYRKDFFYLADLVIAGVPLGYTFGRLGNFFNGELYGRVSTAPWAIIFPQAPRFSTRLSWVREIADQLGISYSSSGMVNLPRHPSQLYEALFEGIILWLIIWFFARKKKKYEGYLLSIYLIGYGVFRFIIEYFREPDSDLGFVMTLGRSIESTAVVQSILNLSMGQILCLLMIIAGLVMMPLLKRRSLTGTKRR